MTRAILCCLAVAGAVECRAAEPGRFRFHKDLRLPDVRPAAETILAVPFDSDVYAATRDGFPDLRIFDAAGRETPFLIEYVADRRVAYPLDVVRIEEDAAEKSTIVVLRSRREPLVELTLETSSRNFSRDVKLQTPAAEGNRTRWTDVAEGRIALVDFGGHKRRELSIAFPERRRAEYRLVIRNDDNPPLAVTGVKATGCVYRAVFLAGDNMPCRLLYGNADIAAPKYDAAVVFGSLRRPDDRLGECLLGREVAAVGAGDPPSVALRDLLQSGVFWGAMLGVLALVLGWALYRAARRIGDIPKE